MEHMTIAGAIFDMDGTILASSKMWETVESSVLLSFGYTPKPTLRQDVLPLGALDTGPFLKEDYHMRQSVEEINDAIDRRISKYYLSEASLKPGIQDLLQTLRAHGVQLALATATERKHVTPALELTGILPLFDVILTCPEVGHTKHEPQIFQAAMTSMGTTPEETWLFEDALYAIRTAGAMGIVTCAMGDPANRPLWPELLRTADYCLPSAEEWRRILPFAGRMGKPGA